MYHRRYIGQGFLNIVHTDFFYLHVIEMIQERLGFIREYITQFICDNSIRNSITTTHEKDIKIIT